MYKKDRFRFGFNDQPMMIESCVAHGWQYILVYQRNTSAWWGIERQNTLSIKIRHAIRSTLVSAFYSSFQLFCSLLLKLLFNYKFYEHILWEINCRGKEILHLWALNVFCIYILQCFANYKYMSNSRCNIWKWFWGIAPRKKSWMKWNISIGKYIYCHKILVAI